MKGVLLALAFVIVLCANALITLAYLVLRGMGHGSNAPLDIAVVIAWVSVVVSLLWWRGNVLLRLVLASGPLLLLVALIGYTALRYPP